MKHYIDFFLISESWEVMECNNVITYLLFIIPTKPSILSGTVDLKQSYSCATPYVMYGK